MIHFSKIFCNRLLLQQQNLQRDQRKSLVIKHWRIRKGCVCFFIFLDREPPNTESRLGTSSIYLQGHWIDELRIRSCCGSRKESPLARHLKAQRSNACIKACRISTRRIKACYRVGHSPQEGRSTKSNGSSKVWNANIEGKKKKKKKFFCSDSHLLPF